MQGKPATKEAQPNRHQNPHPGAAAEKRKILGGARCAVRWGDDDQLQKKSPGSLGSREKHLVTDNFKTWLKVEGRNRKWK